MQLNTDIGLVGLPLECALATYHPYTKEELRASDLIEAQRIAYARSLSPSYVRALISETRADTIKLGPDFSDYDSTPYAYGLEAVVYYLMDKNGTPYVLKLIHSDGDPEEKLTSMEYYHERYVKHFGHLVVPRTVFMAAHPYNQDKKVIGMLQIREEGKCLFEITERANKEELELYRIGAQNMQDEDELLADVQGTGNVKINENGNLRIVDTGYAMSKTEALKNRTKWPRLIPRLQMLGVMIPDIT